MKPVKITAHHNIHGGRTIELYGVQFPSGMIRAGRREYVIHNYGPTLEPTKRELNRVLPDGQILIGEITSIEELSPQT